jgi:hypothetical protein
VHRASKADRNGRHPGEFWADSSFGDSTEHFTARVRLVPWGDFMNPERRSSDPARWYVDVLSEQWRDGQLATCSDTWQVFPPLGGLPDWLTSTTAVEDLRTDKSYYYLAGALITYGVVDASGCLDRRPASAQHRQPMRSRSRPSAVDGVAKPV